MATKVVVEEALKAASQPMYQLSEFCRQLGDGTLTYGPNSHLQAINEHRNPFAPPLVTEVDVNDRIQWWVQHYKKVYRMNTDFSGLIIPPRQAGFDRLVIVPKGFKMKRWVEAASKIHGVYLYKDSLDDAVPEHERSAKDRAYAIWIRDRQEADEELQNLSATTLAEQRVPGICLPERLLAGTAYLFEEGRHMDESNVTLCPGSRGSDGDVPYVHWSADNRKVQVNWYSPVSASSAPPRSCSSFHSPLIFTLVPLLRISGPKRLPFGSFLV